MSAGTHLPVTVTGLHDCDLFTRTAAAIACKLGVECVLKSDADSQSISLGGISRAPPTLDQLSADKDLLAKWASKADGSTPGDLLEALSEAASVFAGILLKPAPPAQKALRPQAKKLMGSVEALVNARGTSGADGLSVAEVGAAAAVLLWLGPAASHCRWFKLLDAAGSFPGCAAVADAINSMLAAADLAMPRSAFVAHLAKPAVVPRPPALGIGRMQHQALRSQMATCFASAEAILAEIESFADGKSALPALDQVDKLARLFGQFVVVTKAHSEMEDGIIYLELEKAFPGCTARHTVEHENEVPELVAVHARLLAAASALRTLSESDDGSAPAADTDELRSAVDDAKKAHAAALEAAAEHRTALAAQAEATAAKAKRDASAGVTAEGAAPAATTAADDDSTDDAANTEAGAASEEEEGTSGVAGTSAVDAGAMAAVAAPVPASTIPQAAAALWTACAQVRQSRDDVEAHLVGEETNLFPRLQKLPPPVRKATAGKCVALLKPTHEEVLPALLAAMNPAQADHYVHVIHTMGGLSDDEWASLIAGLRAGVAAGDMSQGQLDALAARSGPVRAMLATLAAADKATPSSAPPAQAA